MVCEAVKVAAETSFRELEDAFLQTQTRLWLGEVLQIRLNEQLIVSEVLADGELLFQVSVVVWKLLLAKDMELLHKIAYRDQPFASKKNTSGKYTPYSNVDSFLKICKIVGLTGIDLFSPSDVVEKRNTRKVCMCIRSFSKRARSININVPDFDVVTYTVAMPKNMVRYIRRNLELSQNNLSAGSPSYYLQKHAGQKLQQDYSVTASSRNRDMYSEDAGEDSSCTNSNLEDSPMSPMVQESFWPKDFSQSDIQRNENCKRDLFYEENNALRVHKSGSSHGSNSTPGTIGEDMEESCVADMNYWLVEALKMEGQFDAENNFQKIQSSESFGKAFEDSHHSLYKYSSDSFMDKTNSDEVISHNHSDIFLTHLTLLQRYEVDCCKWDQQDKCANNDHNSSCSSLLDKESTSPVEASKDLSFSTTNEQEVAVAKVDKDDKRKILGVTANDGPASRNEDVSDTGSILTSESLNSEYNDGLQACESDMTHTTEFHSQEETIKEIWTGKPHKKLVLKSVVGGTAAFGLVFMMLLHLRRNIGKKVAESMTAFGDIQKCSSSEKAQRKSGRGGVYPAEMLKLG